MSKGLARGQRPQATGAILITAMAANYKTTLVGFLCLAGAVFAYMSGKSDAALGLIGAGLTAILAKDGDKT